MDPITQLGAAAALGRAGVGRLSRLATTAVVAGALVPSLDILSVVGGPRAYLALHRTATGSLAGGAVLAGLVAVGLWLVGRKWEPEPARLAGLLAAAACGASAHLLLDLGDDYGEKLLWPFRGKWYALDLWPQLDPWLLLLLAVALGVPWLLSLVGEEMGAKRRRGVSVSGIITLALVAGYCGWRAHLHSQALLELYSSTYHGQQPLSVEAFPRADSPWAWRGVIDTEKSIDIVEVRLNAEPPFDPDMALTHFKPEEGPALNAAEKARGVAAWLAFARFPVAEITDTDSGGTDVFFRDLRFAGNQGLGANPTVTVHLDKRNEVRGVDWRFGVPR